MSQPIAKTVRIKSDLYDRIMVFKDDHDIESDNEAIIELLQIALRRANDPAVSTSGGAAVDADTIKLAVIDALHETFIPAVESSNDKSMSELRDLVSNWGIASLGAQHQTGTAIDLMLRGVSPQIKGLAQTLLTMLPPIHAGESKEITRSREFYQKLAAWELPTPTEIADASAARVASLFSELDN